MFCLDYVLAFASHYALCALAVDERGLALPSALLSHPLFTAPSGFAAGAAAAVLLWPIDVVRMHSVPAGTSHFAFSTIPFMTVYLGVYFGCQGSAAMRRRTPLASKLGYATVATATAALAELPFDQAKIAMSGGTLRRAALANGLRVPLGAGLLVAYDQISCSEALARRLGTTAISGSRARV